MSGKKVIIIGAGIAGLSAGCYLRMNGYDTLIFEAHKLAGGLCTSWKKDGYLFDGCLHSVGALLPRYKLYHWWNELVELDNIEFHYHSVLTRFYDADGSVVTFYTDPDLLEKELKSIAPEDGRFIDDLIKAVKHFTKYDMQLAKPIELWNPLDYYLSQFRTAPYRAYLAKWQKSMSELTRNLKSERLKRVLNQDFFSHFPAYFFIISLADLSQKNAGYPLGGSLRFAYQIEKKYSALGGQICFDARVRRIHVQDGRAVGVTLENGESYPADFVISAADGYATIFNMLEGKYLDQKIVRRYENHPMWPSAVLISLGLARSFENEPSQVELGLTEPLVIDARSKLASLPITIYNYDPTLAPAGKTCLRAILKTDNYRYWQDLRDQAPEQYEREKQRVASDLIDILDQRLGHIKDCLEVVDVATPATFIRYTGNWKGSIQGWDWLPALIPETIKKTLPGLKNFYMIGQWTTPGGGVSSAFVSGRDLARILCHNDHRKFQLQSEPWGGAAPWIG